MQACLDKKTLSVESVKYTIWRVLSVDPDGDVPDSSSGRAPIMLIPLLFAAVISMVTGSRWCLLSFIFFKSSMDPRQD